VAEYPARASKAVNLAVLINSLPERSSLSGNHPHYLHYPPIPFSSERDYCLPEKALGSGGSAGWLQSALEPYECYQ